MNITYYLQEIASPYYIWFSQTPPPADVGVKQLYPFTISLSCNDYGIHDIDLIYLLHLFV